MVVPDLRLDVNLDHANAAFHKAAGHQAAPSIGSGEFVIQAVHLACRFGLLGDIERVGSFDLHACGKLVRGDASVEIGLAGTLGLMGGVHAVKQAAAQIHNGARPILGRLQVE